MARANGRTDNRLDSPKGLRTNFTLFQSRDRTGRFSEAFARAMGTPWFLIGMTIFVTVWLVFNTVAPEELQFDPRLTNFTLLTLILLPILYLRFAHPKPDAALARLEMNHD